MYGTVKWSSFDVECCLQTTKSLQLLFVGLGTSRDTKMDLKLPAHEHCRAPGLAMVSPWGDPGQQLPEACCARRARLVWYSCYTLTFLDLLGDRFGLVWYSWYTRTFLDLLGDRFGSVWYSCYTLTFLDLLGDRFGLVRFSCYTLTFLDLLGDRFGLVWYSCYTLTFLDLLGDRFSVSDSGVRFWCPILLSWCPILAIRLYVANIQGHESCRLPSYRATRGCMLPTYRNIGGCRLPTYRAMRVLGCQHTGIRGL